MADKISFRELIYHITAQIPEGKVATYGQLALLAGKPRAARAVGEALRHNPYGSGIPCHRVLNRLGELAPAGVFRGGEQRALLMEEGVPFDREGRVDLRACQWDARGLRLPEAAGTGKKKS